MNPCLCGCSYHAQACPGCFTCPEYEPFDGTDGPRPLHGSWASNGPTINREAPEPGHIVSGRGR